MDVELCRSEKSCKCVFKVLFLHSQTTQFSLQLRLRVIVEYSLINNLDGDLLLRDIVRGQLDNSEVALVDSASQFIAAHTAGLHLCIFPSKFQWHFNNITLHLCIVYGNIEPRCMLCVLCIRDAHYVSVELSEYIVRRCGSHPLDGVRSASGTLSPHVSSKQVQSAQKRLQGTLRIVRMTQTLKELFPKCTLRSRALYLSLVSRSGLTVVNSHAYDHVRACLKPILLQDLGRSSSHLHDVLLTKGMLPARARQNVTFGAHKSRVA